MFFAEEEEEGEEEEEEKRRSSSCCSGALRRPRGSFQCPRRGAARGRLLRHEKGFSFHRALNALSAHFSKESISFPVFCSLFRFAFPSVLFSSVNDARPFLNILFEEKKAGSFLIFYFTA